MSMICEKPSMPKTSAVPPIAVTLAPSAPSTKSSVPVTVAPSATFWFGSGDAAGDARELNPATEPARVRAMFVRGDWTRRGLGTRILQACEEAARAEGFGALALVSTLPGLLLYERYGFVTTAEAPVIMPDGTHVAAVSMHLSLP